MDNRLNYVFYLCFIYLQTHKLEYLDYMFLEMNMFELSMIQYKQRNITSKKYTNKPQY